jgi:hypothetical protein
MLSAVMLSVMASYEEWIKFRNNIIKGWLHYSDYYPKLVPFQGPKNIVYIFKKALA